MMVYADNEGAMCIDVGHARGLLYVVKTTILLLQRSNRKTQDGTPGIKRPCQRELNTGIKAFWVDVPPFGDRSFRCYEALVTGHRPTPEIELTLVPCPPFLVSGLH